MFSTFRVFRSLSVLVLLSAEIIVTVGSYVAATVLIARVSGQALLLDAEVFFNLLLVSTAIIITLYLQGLYADIRLRSKVLLVQQLCFAIGIAFLLESMLNFFSPPLLIPRQVMLLGSLLAIGGLFLFRWVYLTQIVNRFPADKLLILGRSDIAAQLDQRLRERPELSMQIVGYLDNDDAPGRMQPWLGRFDNLMEAVEKTTPDRIVLDVGNDHENLPLKTLLQLRMAGLPIDDIGRIYRVAFRRVALATERDLIFQPEYSAAGDWSSLTRWISAALGLVLGLLATPLMLVLWLGLKLTTSGPVLERQRCVGLRGQTFDLFRFHCPRDSQGELTPLARWVQRKRLQGLLQILNLLRGDIGLVGPKPEPAEEFQQSAQTIPFYAQRLLVKPGLTGWAQIQDTSPSDKIRQIEYDLYYIRHRTLALDLYTLLQSIII